MKYVLAATGNTEAQLALRQALSDDFSVDITDSAQHCVELFTKKEYEFLFIDILLLDEPRPQEPEPPTYKKIFQDYWKLLPSIQIIVLCSQETIRSAVGAVKAGAGNYLLCPIDKKEVKYIIESTIETLRAKYEFDYFRDQFWDRDSIRIVSTNNESMRRVFERVKSVAPTDTTVLITGDTGTGKGVIAKLIHAHSPRKHKQFISVHCGAIPESLIESELFGHEKGAFTGAMKRKLGKFEIAQNGTLFLDEIGTMPISAQVRLLQVLQDRSFQRVGGEDNIKADVRIIAASNMNLHQMIERGEFRNDLFYRLNVFPIELPLLRDRLEDIPLLAEEFLHRLNRIHPRQILSIHPEVLEAFRRYSWPGNIRELENLVERAYLLETSSILSPESFPGELFTAAKPFAEIALNTSLTLSEVRNRSYQDIERNYLKEQLAQHNGRINATAHAAGITSRQLHKLLAKHGIRKEDFKTKKIYGAFRNPEFRNTAPSPTPPPLSPSRQTTPQKEMSFSAA
jgi:DNA-binding NtrC family response regulator